MGTAANYTWVPSTARVILVDGFGTVPRATFQSVPQPPQTWPAKYPTDTLDYVFDISEAVAGNEGDAIATLDVSIYPNNPGDLALQSSSADGDQAVLWLTGGISGTTYAVTVITGTNSGRVIGRTVNLPVISLANASQTSNDITDQLGAPITDQYGNPVTTS